jgi:SAM-dependent methyltransferase
MGTATVQGELWSVHASNWAKFQEQMLLPAYQAVFEQTGVGVNTRLLDVGCGTGLAAQLAARLGARVSGIDAAPAAIAIARERTPSGDFRVGEMEELPYADDSFDVVTGFNAFQYAADPVGALQQARRVVRPGGAVVMLTWGSAQECEHSHTLAAVNALLPPPPPGAGGPFALSEPGKLEALLQSAGLQPQRSGAADCPFVYPDDETAWQAISSPGVMVRPLRAAGEERVRQAILASLVPYRANGSGYRQENRFRYVIATH